ncbi:MAG: sigma-70 family RNA polymerase sigma factor [Bifidobacteriaceae bacterium]|jgi:RNA polymerase sigma factor (sigma-70 family)|nr:sigma-70 family RNA polymerase sigma factor [Bifidobacteriaceae bacterium]
MSPVLTAATDLQLVDRVRAGDSDALAVLWERHAGPGRVVAAATTARFDPDDLVAEAFARILESIQKGKGPVGAFRPYLFRVIRNTAARWGRDDRSHATADLDDLAGLAGPGGIDGLGAAEPASEEDTALKAVDSALTARAFRSLPTRYQEVLWYTEVEGLTPAQTAPLLSAKPGNVAVLAHRARKALKEAWIQVHVERATVEGPEHKWCVDHIGAYASGSLHGRKLDRMQAHLLACPRCAIVAEEADDAASHLGLVILPAAAGLAGAAAIKVAAQLGLHTPAASALPHALAAATAGAGAAAGGGSIALPLGLAGALAGVVGAVVATAVIVSGPAPVAGPSPTPVAAVQTGAAVSITDVDTGSGHLFEPIVTGTARPGATVTLRATGGGDVPVTAGADGRWTSPELAGAAGAGQVSATSDGTTATASYQATAPISVGLAGTVSGVTVAVHGVAGAAIDLLPDGRDGLWPTATLDQGGSATAWYPWRPASGTHTVEVRYTDGTRHGPVLRATVQLPGVAADPPSAPGTTSATATPATATTTSGH